MDGWIASAPNDELRMGATTLRDATTAAITQGDLDAFDTDGTRDRGAVDHPAVLRVGPVTDVEHVHPDRR